jgi:hypothetical protein
MLPFVYAVRAMVFHSTHVHDMHNEWETAFDPLHNSDAGVANPSCPS